MFAVGTSTRRDFEFCHRLQVFQADLYVAFSHAAFSCKCWYAGIGDAGIVGKVSNGEQHEKVAALSR